MNPYQGQYWRDVNPHSTLTKVEHTFWITKQNVLKKIGKKDDECIVASDAELDAKLELFRSIQESCMDLQKIVDRYQDRLCCVAQEENILGRFLKEAGAGDDTRAGRMMNNVGRAISYSGKQRLIVRPALLRLLQEVETFRLRAIADTLANLRAMEKQRVEYRASLSWMKDVSQELDPERQLDKFRKVQGQVRRSKVRFDQLKLDCLQKVDLLAAARCNMFSHGLVLYHKTMLEFCEKAAHAFEAVANTCKGYQHYEFSVVKELMEPSMRLAEQLNANSSHQQPEEEKKSDNDILLFFDSEYCDEEASSKDALDRKADITASFDPQPLLDLASISVTDQESLSKSTNGGPGQTNLDLESSMALLEGLFQQGGGGDENWSREWDEVFGNSESPHKAVTLQKPSQSCFPSLLIEQTPAWNIPSLLDDVGEAAAPMKPLPCSATNKSTGNPWLNLFADLDPLSDPDAVGAAVAFDRNC